MQLREAHMAEKPVTMLIAQNANLNRDTKKRKQPFTLEDFYLFQPQEDKNLPSERYGAAAMWLAARGEFPSFALFCFPELRKNAGKRAPTVVAYMHPSAILLAPSETPEGIKGLLIVESVVSEQTITMRTPCGQERTVVIPTVRDEVAAEEDITLLFG